MSRVFSSVPQRLATAVAVLALAVTGCKPGAEKKAPSEEEAATPTVKVAPVTRGALVETVSLVGELQGVEEVRVFALVTERLRTLSVLDGRPLVAVEHVVRERLPRLAEHRA